jgi:hypothetical protein
MEEKLVKWHGGFFFFGLWCGVHLGSGKKKEGNEIEASEGEKKKDLF